MNLVGFITKKFVTMHGHMNVKYGLCSFFRFLQWFWNYSFIHKF
jgi:hypothetical protein